MDGKPDRVEGGAGGKPSQASSKPPGRLDAAMSAVLYLLDAVHLLAENLDEGPLRTACKKALSKARNEAAYAPSGPLRRLPADDSRTVALQARQRHRDPKR